MLGFTRLLAIVIFSLCTSLTIRDISENFSQEIFTNIGLGKICFKIPKILDLEIVIHIFAYDFANVGMKPETKLQYFDIEGISDF